jgi:hypothetical protein
MRILKSLVAAACAAYAFTAVAPVLSAQSPPAEIMARTVCFDGTEGSIIRWAACKAPQQPVDTTEPGGSFKATCK